MDQIKHGFYSVKCAQLGGSVMYATPDGQKVLVNFVSTDKDGTAFLWKDKVYVGEVTTYIGKGEVSSLISYVPRYLNDTYLQ